MGDDTSPTIASRRKVNTPAGAMRFWNMPTYLASLVTKAASAITVTQMRIWDLIMRGTFFPEYDQNLPSGFCHESSGFLDI